MSTAFKYKRSQFQSYDTFWDTVGTILYYDAKFVCNTLKLNCTPYLQMANGFLVISGASLCEVGGAYNGSTSHYYEQDRDQAQWQQIIPHREDAILFWLQFK